MGSAVMLRDLATGAIETLQLVRADDADPAHDKISVDSPLGRTLVGREEGETITITTFEGARRFEILEVENLLNAS